MDPDDWVNKMEMDTADGLAHNLMDYNKEPDYSNIQDEILPPDIFNDIINKFDFDEADVNINSFLNELHTADSMANGSAKNFDDPLLSLSNTNMNYNNFSFNATATKPVSATSTVQAHQVRSNGDPSVQMETVVYQLAAAADDTNNPAQYLTQPPPYAVHQQRVLKSIAPVQMVFDNASNIQPLQNFDNLTDTKPILVKTTEALIDSTPKQIIISPTVMYSTGTGSTMQSVQLIDANGTILSTHVPVSTIVVEPQQTQHMRAVQQEPLRSGPPRVKEVKRSTHNAIEKRYRTSINDKIVELKNILVGEGGKLNKSAILKRSIEKISDLEGQNYELQLENARLREMLNAQLSSGGPEDKSLKDLLLLKPLMQNKRRYTQSSTGSVTEFGDRMTPPPTSDESNPSLSPTHSYTGSMPSPLAHDEISKDIYGGAGGYEQAASSKRTRQSSAGDTTHGMSTLSKLTLCAFMFAIVTINPLASFIAPAATAGNYFDEPVEVSRRTILGIDSGPMNFFDVLWRRFTGSVLVLALNLVVLTACMVKLCYHSDSILNFCSPAAEKYRKQKRIADAEFEAGNASAAFAAYEKCLLLFGITLPQTYYEVWPTIFLQFCRCCMHRLWIGWYVNRKLGRIIYSDEKKNDAVNSAQELAIILNRCNQIHLSQNMYDGRGLILTMHSVNLAEVATNIDPVNLLDIYLTAALRCRRNYMHLFSWMCSRYYFYKAKATAGGMDETQIPAKFAWIFSSPDGYKFLCKFSFDAIVDGPEATIFHQEVNRLDTLSTVHRHYTQHLMKCTLQSLIGDTCITNGEIGLCESSDATLLSDVLIYARLLTETCRDELTLWWTKLFCIDALWLLDKDAGAEKLFETARKIPKSLFDSKDTLSRSAIVIFCAKKLLAGKQPAHAAKIWSLCNCASKLFDKSMVNKGNKNDLTLYIQLLICDWLLEARTACWELKQNEKLPMHEEENNNECCAKTLSSHELEEFQNDLNSLYFIIDQIPMAKSRVYLYEAVSRLMAGASPGQTQELLDRSLHDQYRRNARLSFHCGGSSQAGANSASAPTTNSGSPRATSAVATRRNSGQGVTAHSGDRERATAMYVACKYLPKSLLSSPGERIGMLAEAARTLQKIGDRKKLDDCYQLMRSIGGATSASSKCN